MEVRLINLDDVLFQAEALRSHKIDSQDIKDAAEDLMERGLLNLMSVIPSQEQEGKYYVKDGARRTSALKLLKNEGRIPPNMDTIEAVPYQIFPMQDELDNLADMVAGNAQVKKTTSKEFIQAMHKLVTETDLSMEQLSKKVGMKVDYIWKLFKTLKLGEEILKKAQEMSIPITNLITLSELAKKVDNDEMEEWLERAKEETIGEFSKSISERLDLIPKKGRSSEEKFILTPIFIGKDSLNMLLTQTQIKFEQTGDPIDEARYELMKEIYQIDEPTAHKREKEWEKKQDEKARKSAERKAAREKAKLEESKEELEKLGYEVILKK